MPERSIQNERLRRPGRQLLDLLRQRLGRGDWPVGTRLPPTRRLAQEHGVSRVTVQSVLALLAGEGWLRREGRSGIYVQRAGSSSSLRPSLPRAAAAPDQAQGLIDFDLEARPVQGIGPRWSDEVLAGAHEELAARKLHAAIFAPIQLGEEAQRQFMERLTRAADHVIGVLALQPYLVESMERQIEALGLPCVLVHRRRPSDLHNFVTADHWGGGQTLGRLLAQQDARHIVYLSGDHPGQTDHLRFCSDRELIEGFLSGYAQARGSLPASFDIEPCGGTSQDDGRLAVARRLQRGPAPQAIIAAGDFLAVGAIRACSDARLDVPRQMAVIGTTGLWIARESQPTLTTMTQPMRRIGAVAARMLLHLAHSSRRRVAGRVLPCRIDLRQSWQPDARLLADAGLLPTHVRIDRAAGPAQP